MTVMQLPLDIEAMMRSIELIVAMQSRILEILVARTGSSTQEWYSPSEFAAAVGRKPFTVRQWLRKGRLNARKRGLGRGGKLAWEIHRTELEYYRNHGLRS